MKITKLLSKITAIFSKVKEAKKAHPTTPEAVPTSGANKQGLEVVEETPPPAESVQENQIENKEKEKLAERDATKAKERGLASEDTQRLARFNVVEAVNRSATAIEKYDSFKSNPPQSPRKGTAAAQSPIFKMISENTPTITESPVGFEPPELDLPLQIDNIVGRPSVNLRPEIAMDQTQKMLLSADSAEKIAKEMAPAKIKSVNLRIIAKDDTEKALCVDLDKVASTSTTTTDTSRKVAIEPAPLGKNEKAKNATPPITKKTSLQVRQLTKEDTEQDMHVSNDTYATSPSRSNTKGATSISPMIGQRKASISLKTTDPLSTTQKMLIEEPDALTQGSVKKEGLSSQSLHLDSAALLSGSTDDQKERETSAAAFFPTLAKSDSKAISPSRSNTNTAISIPTMFGQRKASISLKTTDPLSTTQKMLIEEPDVPKQDSVKKEVTPPTSTLSTNHTVSASSSAPPPARRASISLKSDPLNTTLKMLPTEAVKEVEDIKE